MRRLIRPLLAVLCLGATVGFFAPPAAAQGSCDSTVIDKAGVFGDDFNDIERQAEQLAKSVGATVYIRTVKSVGNAGSLDNLYRQTVNDCSSWQDVNADVDASGNRYEKVNLLTFWMGLDHTVAIFYGSRWETAFSNYGGEQKIYSTYMGPNFASGDFARGFSEGMSETKTLLNNFLHPPANTGSSGGKTTIINEKPGDYTWIIWVVGIIVAALILGFGGYFGYSFLMERKRQEEERRTARQRAMAARDATNAILDTISGDTNAAVRLAKVTTYSAAPGTGLAALRERADSEIQQAINGLTGVAAAGAGADTSNLTTGEYTVMAERYEAALVHAKAAQAAAQEIDVTCADIQRRLDAVPDSIAVVQARADKLKADIQALVAEQIKVEDIDRYLTGGYISLESAQANSTDLSALQDLADASESLKTGEAMLSELQDRRQKLREGIPALASRLADTRQSVTSARACFDRIAGAYAPSSWEAVSGNGSESEKRLDAVAELLQRATAESSIDTQDWEAALLTVQEGNQIIDDVEGLLRSITELERNLQIAKDTAPQEIADAEADIAKAEEYLRIHDADIEDHHTEAINKAKEVLAEAKLALSRDLPDYLLVVKLARAANSAADEIFNEFVEEHEAAERLRRQAASAVSATKGAINTTYEFIQDHSSDVGSGPESDLSKARSLLAEAEGTSDAHSRLRLAEQAEQHANNAYSHAKRQFDAAEEERERERRRRREAEEARRRAREEAEESARRSREASYSSISHSSHSSSSSFDFGGGSSSSWGGGDHGGGSSGSW